ncbi:MAG: transposase [Candidatus Marinimicrobia bacterium]|nr:transposase [Candidatus Neomarinimicrobiota bacterium]|tara:strand:+ start:3392 stop:4903 length:1512 start_codon:yes stop_codon:yes gene_type:complete
MKKILSLASLKSKLDKFKKKRKKIILCHGVFDFLHLGHLEHFKSAKKLGDILVVSVTTDAYVNKGINRPMFNTQTRKRILSELSSVDFVCESNSNDAINVIDNLKPNIYCKGPDYKKTKNDKTNKILKEIRAVKKNGGKFVTTSDVTFSSSNFINLLNKNKTEQDRFLSKINKKFTKKNIINEIDKFKKLKILVIGESIIDEYIFCETIGKSGKEPVITVNPKYSEKYLGGSLAVCNHLSSFSKKITLLSYLGKNQEQLSFIKRKIKKNVVCDFIVKAHSPTIIKKRIIDQINKTKILGMYTINDELIGKKNENQLIKKINKLKKEHDLIIFCDYGHGLITKKISNLIIKSGKKYTVNAQINSSNSSHHSIDKYKKACGIVINANELRHEFRDNETSIFRLAQRLQIKAKTKNILVTEGSDGAKIVSDNKLFSSPAFTKNIVDKIGAGDAMLAIASICFALNLDKDLNLYLSSLAAAHCVENISNSSPVDKNNILKIISHQIN